MEFPLVNRELERQTGRKTTYALRLAVGAVAFLFLAFMAATTTVHPENLGSGLLGIATMFQFLSALFLPAMLAGGAIAQERQDRTLGLLLLADVRGAGVSIAKFLSAYLPCQMLILGALPILVLAVFFGGVEPEGIIWQTVLFSVAAMTACAVSLLVSAFAVRPGKAQMSSLIIVVGSMIAYSFVERPGIWGIPAKPLPYNLHSADAALEATGGPLTPWFWVPSTIVSLSLTVVCLAATVALLPRLVAGRSVGRAGPLRRRRVARRRLRNHRRPGSALVAAAMTSSLSSHRPWPLRLAASLTLAIAGVFWCVGFLFVAAIAAYDLMSSLDGARRRGALDDVRLASPNDKAMARSIFRVSFLRALFYFPALFVCGEFGGRFLIVLWLFEFTSASTGAGLFAEQLLVIVLFALPLVAVTLCECGLLAGIVCAFTGKSRRKLWGRTVSALFVFCLVELGWGAFQAFILFPSMAVGGFDDSVLTLLGAAFGRGFLGVLVLGGIAWASYESFTTGVVHRDALAHGPAT